MIEPPVLYLDTNVFIAAIENRHELAFDLLEIGALSTTTILCTSLLTIAELLVKPLKEENDRLVEIYKALADGNDGLSVGPVDKDSLYHASVLRANYRFLKLPDAIHLSTAIGFRCKYFVSFDDDLKKINAITHTRWGVTKAQPTPKYISPDESKFQDLVSDLTK
ncbi:MAG: PIN domain-containing protein [Pseudomonadota bacterium]